MELNSTYPLVVLVDDEEYILEFMKSDLEKNDLNVKSFNCPKEAIYYLTTSKLNRQDSNAIFLITDFRMPYLSGIDLIEKLNEYSIKIKNSIVLSGFIPREDFERINEMTNVEVMEKPVDIGLILKKIKST